MLLVDEIVMAITTFGEFANFWMNVYKLDEHL